MQGVRIPSRERVAAHKAARTEPGFTFTLDGDVAVIRWTFVFTRMDGTSFRMEEIAWQRWRGERIVEERFFYDPAQLQQRLASS